MRWKVGHHDLKNGIRVYSFYDSGGTTHICGVGFRVGAIHDKDARGVPHLVEHAISRESTTHDGDEVYRILWRYFGEPEDIRIQTDHNYTYYGGGGVYKRRYMHEVMPLFVSLVRDRIITEDGINTEKGAVYNEFPLTESDVALERLQLAFYQTMYETNPIRFSVLGRDREDLISLEPQVLKRFVKKFYIAQNMFVPIFGPTKEESKKFAEKYLDDWPYQGSPASVDFESFDKIPVITSPRLHELSLPGLQTYYVQLGFPTECYTSGDDAVLDVMADLIRGRIVNALREKNLDPRKGVYRSPGYTFRTLTHGEIGVWFTSVDRDYALYGRDVVLGEFARLREELVLKSQVDDTIAAIRETFFMKFRDSPEQVLDLVIEAASRGDPDLTHLHSYPDRLEKVTNKTIRKIANKYLKPDGYVCAMLMPA